MDYMLDSACLKSATNAIFCFLIMYLLKITLKSGTLGFFLLGFTPSIFFREWDLALFLGLRK